MDEWTHGRRVGAVVAVALLVGCGGPRPEVTGVAATGAAPTVEQLEAAVPERARKEAYFGETHVHTSFSLDAYVGGARITPSDAYRFAKGEDVTLDGTPHNIRKPLDFAAVTDHSEYLGEMYSAQVAGAPGYDHPDLVQLRGLTGYEERERWYAEKFIANARSAKPSHPAFYAGEGTTRSAWQDVVLAAARDHYAPGRFTTLAGYEWTATFKGGNMHRVVLFRDMNVPDLPLDAFAEPDEEKLWAWMASQEQQGRRVMAIPHNSNASKGFMFEPLDNAGRPISAEYARLRSRYEPLIEMMQIKANSEVHPRFWAADEFAGFENGNSIQKNNQRTYRKESFVRWAVIKGLHYQATLGENPYKYGFTGGTDSHNGTAGDVVEDNYVGSHGAGDNTVALRRTAEITGWIADRDANPGALAGVWATRNTRAAIWDAMAARETFVTSGTRIKVRFFGGVGLGAPADATALVDAGYRDGVPMGGTITGAASAPRFTVWASKDPDGANLDRIQVVKGWVDASGEPHDRVFDVAWSGDRKPGKGGKVPAVGNTVDLATARYTNAIGAPELLGSWTDPTFDPAQHALYYVRVLEIPTPRWTTYDAVRNNLPLLEDVPATVQERAWTSPIWVAPRGAVGR